MFETRDIAQNRLAAPAAATDTADTTITVNSGGGTPPPRPEFRMPERPAEPPTEGQGEPRPSSPRTTETTEGTTGQTHTQRTARPRSTETTERVPSQTHTQRTVITPPSASTSNHRQVNWGGVIKGVAIVSAVVLAAVVAYTVVVPAVGGALSWLGANTFLGSAINAVAPAVTWLADVAMSGALFVGHFIESFVGAAFAGTGIASAFAGGAAVAPATATAISTTGGALAAGGVFAAGVPIAAKAIMTTPMVDVVHTDTTTAPALTGAETHAPAAHAPSQHGHGSHVQPAGSQASSATQQAHIDPLEIPDDALHQQASSIKTSSKMAHHAAHAAESGHGDHSGHDQADSGGEAPDAPERRTRSALRNSAHASQEWAERVGQRQQAAVNRRSSQFSSELAAERERLDQALGQPQVG